MRKPTMFRLAVACLVATSWVTWAIAPVSAVTLPTYVGDFVGPGLAGMYPVDVAASDTDYYVLDAGRYRIVAVSRATGLTDATIGSAGQVGGHQGQSNTSFGAARGIARDDVAGNIYLADTSNNRVVEYDSNLSYVRQWGKKPTASCSNGCFNQDYGVTVGRGLDAANKPAQVVYVTDGSGPTGSRVQVFTTDGKWIRTFGAGRLNKPRQLAVDPVTDQVYVISAADRLIDVFTPAGVFVRAFGGTSTTANVLGKFNQDPRGIAIDYINTGSGPVGHVFVSDPASGWVQSFGVTGATQCAFGTEGAGPDQFVDIRALTTTTDHLLLVTDQWGFALKEFNLSAFAGSCTIGGDVTFVRSLFGAPPSTPGVDSPRGLDVDAAGNLFLSDWWNQRIERVTPSSGSPPVPTNPGTWGFRGTRQQDGALNFAWDLAVQPGTERVFVANRESHEIRVFDGATSGAQITHWGKQGSATGTAQFKFPQGVAFAPDGVHLFVADSGNSRVLVFTIDPVTGKPSPVGALASFGTAGALVGQFKVPTEVAVATDSGSGNTYLWVADTQNNRIQRCRLNSTYTTCAWTAIATPSGGTKFKLPWGVSVGPDGNIWVADSGNNRIVEMTPNGVQVLAFSGTDVGAGAFSGPFDVAFMGTYILVSDTWNNRIVMLKP